MPLKSKKPVSKPKAKAKKTPSKPLLKSVKPKLEAKSPAKKSAKSPPKSIFWQILEERKKQKENGPPQPYKSDHRGQHAQPSRHEQFAKFAGPRRRAA